MAVAEGTRLGPYEILAPIGAGGMGEVYKARDTRLDRTVAIKVLPSHLASSAELRQRFEREARTVSSLNHPHICVLHDIGQQDEVAFLVMEYLEGETLAQRLAKGPLPFDQVLLYAGQIADALDRAHRQGVIHRDLKPGNVMLTKSGAKLLDFGLAKSAPLAAAAIADATLTRHEPLTERGSIVGTLQYMAPEQLEGKEADARSDIFAFGALLYEMASGKRAFSGKNQASVVASVLASEPQPISTVQPMCPPAIDRVVKVCLAKDPDERWQTVHDLKLQLQWIAEGGSQAGIPAPLVKRRKLRQHLAWGVAAICFVAALALATAHVLRTTIPAIPVQSSLLPPKGASYAVASFAISPDGTKLVFLADIPNAASMLWIRPLNSTVSQPLPGTEGASVPFWSPDSKYVGFVAGFKLKKIDAAGGPVITIADAGFGPGASWGPDGTIVFGYGLGKPGLYQVSSAGGPVSEISEVKNVKLGEQFNPRWPCFLPDGRHLLFENPRAARASLANADAEAASNSTIYVLDLKTRKVTPLLDADSNAEYADGRLLYIQQDNLMAQPFDASSLKLTGNPVPLAEGVQSAVGGDRRQGGFSASASGLLVFQTGTIQLNRLLWFTRDGHEIGQVGSPGSYSVISLSPDEDRLATSVGESKGSKRDIWIYELAKGIPTRLTFDVIQAFTPVWSRDGNKLIYRAVGVNQRDGVSLKASSGLGQAETLKLGTAQAPSPNGLSPDGNSLVYMNFVAGHGPRLWIHQFAPEEKDYPLLQTNFNEAHGQFSPDGHWLAFTSNETGKEEIYVVPFPSLSNKWRVSTTGGVQPRWRRDGKELYYVAPDAKLMAATVEATGGSFKAGTPQPLFQTKIVATTRSYHQYDVTADGQKFIINSRPDPDPQPLTLYANWTASLGGK